MLITEKKLRSIIRNILLKEEEDWLNQNQPPTKSFDEKKALELSRALFLAADENDKRSLAKIANNIGGDNPKFADAMNILNNLNKKDSSEYKELFKMLQDANPKQSTSSKDASTSSTSKTNSGNGQADKKSSSKKSGSSQEIKTIQSLINSLKDQQIIDGDYKGRALSVDGVWGARTRSAVSKALAKFATKEMSDKFGFKEIKDEGLNTKKSGGAGSWEKVLSQLTDGVKPEGNASNFFEKGEYGKLIYVLTKLNGSKEIKPADSGASLKDIGTAYIAVREAFKRHPSEWISKHIITYSIRENKIKIEVLNEDSMSIDPIQAKIKLKFGCDHHTAVSHEYQFEFEFKANNNGNIDDAEIKVIDSNKKLNSTNSRGESLSVKQWKNFNGKVMETDEDWWMDGKEFVNLCLYAVKKALSTKGISKNKDAGGQPNITDFLKNALPKKE